MPYKQLIIDIKSELDRLTAELDRKNLMLAMAKEENAHMKHHIECLEKGTRKLKSEVLMFCGGAMSSDVGILCSAPCDRKKLAGLTLDIAMAVVCGGFKTNPEYFAELKRIAGK